MLLILNKANLMPFMKMQIVYHNIYKHTVLIDSINVLNNDPSTVV